MDLKQIRQLIKMVDDSKIDALEIEEESYKIKITKNRDDSKSNNKPVVMEYPIYSAQGQIPQQIQHQPPAGGTPPAETKATPTAKETDQDSSENLYEVRSPMVGTFYRAPAPDADPYVEVGDSIAVGQTLCIVEAMKLMNEIESEVGGKIRKVLVENAQPVEYNQVLFLVEKT
ncbi:MAG: acetyl-CoA carboxylase biotin carboxyl carrier protein [Caldithrix sp.]|nr:acetyl-CoA carboxylase biotin carboxyl carrier protein [Caldithrix sp.]